MNDDALKSTGAPPAIVIRDLYKSFVGPASISSVNAVDGLSITVPQGSFFGFLGPNGAGKTTTIRILMGTVQPTSGTVEVLGLPLAAHSLDIRKQLGLVPDDTLLFDYLTGSEYLQFIGRLYGLPRDVVRQ
ncbi:MAG TPA: ATP-binding cassette domain-containing protein, partial [Rhizomicrobium sp.]|nr:ATP-binding cassette domain-containing protein [Rhizomicrobium sp.]